jgi:DNA-binding IclR family transcriptional regulator
LEDATSGVKSARRVFEFLEYYAKVERAVSVAEIAKTFGYPNSSVSSVMRTMVTLGYLSYDATTRTYLPTARLPFVTHWIGTRLFDHDRVQSIMRRLSEATDETIVLGVRNGLRLQYLQVVDARSPVRLHAEPGSFRDLTKTAAGLVLLSQYDNARIGQLVRRVNSDRPSDRADASAPTSLPQLLAEIETIRTQGYCVAIGGVVKGAGAIAMLLPRCLGETPLAIGIASVEPVIRQNRDRYVDLMREALQTHDSHREQDTGHQDAGHQDTGAS